MTGFDLFMAISLMIGAGIALSIIDKRMSDRELIAYMNKMHRKRQRALRQQA